MSKEKLAAAKQFIQEKQYREARLILESTDHPTATEWLAKLPKPINSEKLKNSPSSSNRMKTPAVMIAILTLLFLTFVSGIIVGQTMRQYAQNSPLNMTRTAIHNANSTTEALIYETQVARGSLLDMTRTAIRHSNSTTEALISSTQTAIAEKTNANEITDTCTCNPQVATRTLITPSATFTWTPDARYPTWTPTPK